MELILVYYYKLEVCESWILYKLICKNVANMFFETPCLDSFPNTFDYVWSNCDPTFVLIFLN
jgi:hypothetical protein